MNIITNIENTSSTVFIIWKNYSIIEMEYRKNGLNIYIKLINIYYNI